MRGIRQLIANARAHLGLRRYAANTVWMFAEQMLRMLTALFVGIWVARYLGPEQFGLFTYAAAFVSLFGAIAGLGLNSIVVRDLVSHPENRDQYLGTAFWLKLSGAVLALAILAIVLQFTANDATTNLYIMIIGSGLLFQSFEVVDFYFQSKVLSKYVSLCRMTQLAFSSILKLTFIYIQADLFWFVLVSLIDQATLAIALFYAWRIQRLGGFLGRFDFKLAKMMLNNSWPLILSGIAVTLYMRIDQVMIKEMLGEREVGLYSAAVRLSEVWYFVPSIIVASVFPAIVNAKKTSNALYFQRLQQLFTLMAWSAISVAIPMTFLADSLIVLLYGQTYHAAGEVLAIHIWASVFVFLGVASGGYFTVENYARKSLYRTALGALANISLNLVLIPQFGIQGAALATVLSQLIANYVFDIFDSTTRQLLIVKSKALFPIYYLWKHPD